MVFDFGVMLPSYTLLTPEISEAMDMWAVVFPKEVAAKFETGRHSAIRALEHIAADEARIERLQTNLRQVAAALSYASVDCGGMDAMTLQLRCVHRRDALVSLRCLAAPTPYCMMN